MIFNQFQSPIHNINWLKYSYQRHLLNKNTFFRSWKNSWMFTTVIYTLHGLPLSLQHTCWNYFFPHTFSVFLVLVSASDLTCSCTFLSHTCCAVITTTLKWSWSGKWLCDYYKWWNYFFWCSLSSYLIFSATVTACMHVHNLGTCTQTHLAIAHRPLFLTVWFR